MTEVLKKANIWAIAASALLLTGNPQSAASSVCLKGCGNLTDLSGIDEQPIGTARLHAAAVGKEESVVPQELFAKARAEGAVRVIVQMRFSRAAGESREQAIRSARDTLLGQLAGAPHKVLRSYDSIPSVVLEVAVDGLNVLRASSQVIQVSEDRLLRPSQDQSRPAPLRGSAGRKA